jgi:NTP pyrophosphatase (non-canonical NTP hydrolase)
VDYYNFYKKSLALLKGRFVNNYKKVLVKVLFDCFSTIKQVEMDDEKDFEKNLKEFTKKIAPNYR